MSFFYSVVWYQVEKSLSYPQVGKGLSYKEHQKQHSQIL